MGKHIESPRQTAGVRPNVAALRRGGLLAVAWSGWFGMHVHQFIHCALRSPAPDYAPHMLSING
jgi:hypothetical protein